MFAIDFTKPWLYKDVIYFNQGNLATNNILRCKLITGGDITLEGYIASVTFKTLSHAEINTSANIVDKANCVIDVKFPSNSLEVGVNELEVLLNKGEGSDKVVVQSPKIKYEVWQGLTTGNGIQGDNNYPILIDLMSEVRNTVRIANNASATADASLKQAARMIEEVDNTLIKVNNTIEETNNAKDEALEAVEDVNRAIAAGTQDLEVKAAREDAEGVTHDTLALRLKSDFKIGSKSLKQEVLDLAGLKESQDMAYETNKGYLVCKETKAGTVKDLKISGRTIKNIIGVKGKSSFTLNNSVKSRQYTLSEIIKANTTMYFKVNITSKKAPLYGLRVALKNVDGTYSYYDGTKGVYSQSFEITHYKDITSIGLYITNAEFESTLDANITYEKFQVTVAEAYDYFEGIASVGAGVDKIEVSSRKEDGNLLNVNDFVIDKSSLYGYVQVQRENKDVCLSLIEKDASVDISGINLGFTGNGLNAKEGHVWKIDKGVIKSNIFTSSYNFVSFYPKTKETIEKILKRFDIMVNKGTSPIPYQPCKQDKKHLLFKDYGTWKSIEELRGVPKACDTVEIHSDGKYYYHKRTEKVVLNGTENWNIYDIADSHNNRQFYIQPIDVLAVDSRSTVNSINDTYKDTMFNDRHLADNINSLFVNKNLIAILKDVSTSLESFKNELQTKNVTVVYLLAEERVFEVNPLFLEAYEGETSVLCNSGAIRPNMEFKITSYITNLVLLNQQRISLIEQEMFNMFKQVLSGDMYSLAEKLYPEDFIEEKYIATPIPEL